MTKTEKNYLLYSDKEQTELLAAAESLQHAKEVSLNYTEGQWFSYNTLKEHENSLTKLIDEKPIKIKFAKEIVKRTKEEQEHFWKLGGSDLR